MKIFKSAKMRKGFTLIELLIVITILGVLAALILVAIDPLEQIARGEDAGRVTSVGQLGKAVQAYYTSTSGNYPDDTNADSWSKGTFPDDPGSLVGSGEIKKFPSNPDYSSSITMCTNLNQNEFCYAVGASGEEAVVYTATESKASKARAGACTTQPWIAYFTIQGKAGLVCEPNEAAIISDIETGSLTLY